MSNFILLTDMKGRPMIINTDGILSVHQNIEKIQRENVYEIVKVTHVMMDREWGYSCKEDPKLVYDLILEQQESELEMQYDPDFENGEEEETELEP